MKSLLTKNTLMWVGIVTIASVLTLLLLGFAAVFFKNWGFIAFLIVMNWGLITTKNKKPFHVLLLVSLGITIASIATSNIFDLSPWVFITGYTVAVLIIMYAIIWKMPIERIK